MNPEILNLASNELTNAQRNVKVYLSLGCDLHCPSSAYVFLEDEGNKLVPLKF
jgi:uncharacterized radical SAM superfamily Fe-S cluster-containing enzyme